MALCTPSVGSDLEADHDTDHVLAKLGATGRKKLLVICPSFVTDCLETLEEIGIRGRETFRDAGGEELILIPCLNEHSLWVEALEKWIQRWVSPMSYPAQSSSHARVVSELIAGAPCS